MIGVLCGNGKEETYAAILHSLLAPLILKKDVPIVVFTISGIDFSNRMISGSLISEKKIKSVKIELPCLILNFASHHRISDIKKMTKLRNLLEQEEIPLINETNCFNQRTIMDVLSSSPITQKYLLPYGTCAKQGITFDCEKDSNFLLMPQKGANLSEVIYIERQGFSGNVLIQGNSPNNGKSSVNHLLLLQSPKPLISNGEQPLFVRVFLQKHSGNNWVILLITPNIQPMNNRANLKNNLINASLEIINYISHFLPSLAICFLDFTVNSQRKIYFLHLGGCDFFLDEEQPQNIFRNFSKNLLRFLRYTIYQRKKG